MENWTTLHPVDLSYFDTAQHSFSYDVEQLSLAGCLYDGANLSKEGLYAVVVDRELSVLTEAVTTALTAGGTDRQIIERAALALLDYIEGSPDGFRILARDVSGEAPSGTYSSLISDVATQVAHLLSEPFEQRGFDPTTAPMYAQMLVGLVSLTGQWWLETRQPDKESVAAHLVNLAWNGLDGLEPHPTLHGRN